MIIHEYSLVDSTDAENLSAIEDRCGGRLRPHPNHDRPHHRVVTGGRWEMRARQGPDPTVGIVLNGGGARAVTCLGVLDVLTEVVQPRCVIGKSAGAIAGLLLGLGYGPRDILAMLKKELSPGLLRFIPGGSCLHMLSILRGRGLAKALRRYCPANLRLEDLSLRLRVACTDLVRRTSIFLDRGPAIDLVVASCSVPGLGTPFSYQGMLLVDGTVGNPGMLKLPPDLAEDLVVGVGVMPIQEKRPNSGLQPGLWRTLVRSRSIYRTSQYLAHASSYNLIIAPPAPRGFANLRSARIDQLFRLGQETAEANLDVLWALLGGTRSAHAAADKRQLRARFPEPCLAIQETKTCGSRHS